MTDTVEVLRAAFDDRFRLRAAVEEERTGILRVQVGPQRWVLALAEVALLDRTPTLTAVPHQVPAMAGLGLVDGRTVAVYDLGRLLGGAATSAAWSVLSTEDPTIALAFDRVVGLETVPAANAPPPDLVSLTELLTRIDRLIGAHTTTSTRE